MTTKGQHLKFLIIYKLPVIIIVVVFYCAFSFDLVNASNVSALSPDSLSVASDNIYYSVEEMPQFRDGTVGSWIGQHLKYPPEAMERNIQGNVYVQFVVEKDGSISNIRIARGPDSLLNNETLRVMRLMPAWKPGKQKGECVRVGYTFPISFTLNDPKPQEPVQTRSSGGDVYDKVDELPVFSKGQPQMWIARNVRYPVQAMERGIQGKVYVQFVIEKDGSVSNIELLRGVHLLLNQEALQVVRTMPKWKPGKIKGEPVRCSYTLPIFFQLSR